MNDTVDTRQHLLVVEDDTSLASWMADYLASHGFAVSVATRGDEAVHLIETEAADLVILDLNLPVLDGLEVCRQVRHFYDRPIIMLTARDDDTDEILGLNTGADDYLCKPVKPRILLARIRALLRRDVSEQQPTVQRIGGLYIDRQSRTVRLDEAAVELSSNEFDLLSLLADDAGHPVAREALVAKLRGIDYDGFDRSVDIGISRLRRKLGDDGAAPRRIKTLRGTGYLLAPDAW